MATDRSTADNTVPTLAELQERVQGPVREANDIGGVLWGDWLSPPLTMAFVKLGISPTVATVGMLVTGIPGCVLIAMGGGYAVAGAMLVIFFYVLDCVDGEVARYHGKARFYWSYADFFFGIWVMALFYLAIGVQAALQTGIDWLALLGAGCVVFFFTKKFVDVAHIFLTVQHVSLGKGPMAQQFRSEVGGSGPENAMADNAGGNDAATPAVVRKDIVARYGGVVGILRGMALNFHLGAAVFFVLCLLDLIVPMPVVLGTPMNLKTLFLFPCFALLAFNAIDYFLHDMRGGFMAKSRSLLKDL